MTIVIFILILALLIFVHELGHFLVAKISGVRVDEFAIGFPPKLFSYKYGETIYALNLIPFGGYVKIFGEDPNQDSLTGPDKNRSLASQSKKIQASVLVAGVTFNLILAWVLFSLAFVLGFPVSGDLATKFPVTDTRTVISGVLPDSPAQQAELKTGDIVAYVRNLSGDKITVRTVDDLKTIINRLASRPLVVGVEKEGGQIEEVKILASQDIIPGQWAIGLGFEQIAIVDSRWYQAPWFGAQMTYETVVSMVGGLSDLVVKIAQGLPIKEAVVGPVGIAGMVGDARALGLVYLVTFTAFISINLAVINLVPFPALDGGRLFFLIFEAIKGSPLNPKIANTLNLIGFVILISFMLYVTWGDVIKLL